jgi:hypothetical protein
VAGQPVLLRITSLGVCDRGDKGDWKGEWWNRAGPRGRQGATGSYQRAISVTPVTPACLPSDERFSS